MNNISLKFFTFLFCIILFFNSFSQEETITTSCPSSYDSNCSGFTNLVPNGGFNFYSWFHSSWEDKKLDDWFNTGHICDWKDGGSPDLYIKYGRTYAHMWSEGLSYESIIASSNFNISSGDYMFSVDLAAHENPSVGIPDGVRLILKDSTSQVETTVVDIPSSQFQRTSPGSIDFTLSTACFNITQNYDRLIFRPYNNIGNNALSIIYVDNISIIPILASFNAGPDVILEACSSSVIGPDCIIPGASYSWTPTDGINNPNIPNPTISGDNSGIYTLTITTACTSYTDQINVNLNYDLIPNNTNISQLRTIAGLPGSQTSLSDKILKIEGTLIIDESFSFYDCSFYMEEDAKIITQNNASLIFDNLNSDVEFFKPCDPDVYWDGIYQNGGSNFQFGDNHAIGKDSAYWEFNNSKNGINIIDVNNILINEVQFENNGRAIKIENTGTNQTNAAIRSLIIRCTEPLSYNSTSFYPDHAFELININTNQYFQIGSSYSQDSSSFNLYGSGGNIYIENSDDLWLDDIGFYEFNNRFWFPGYPTKSSNAIEVKGNSRNPEVQIRDCYFINCVGGINVSDNTSLDIRDNKVNITKDNVIQDGIEGSYFMHCSDVENTYQGNPISASNYNYLHYIHNNTVYNVEKGIQLFNSHYFYISDNTFDMEVQPNSSSYTDKDNEESVAIYSNAYDLTFHLLTDAFHLVAEGNYISHSKVGIQAEFVRSKIINNTIIDQNNRFTPPQFGTATPAYGIRLLNYSGHIEGNKVENDLSQYSGTMPNTQEKVVGISAENAAGGMGSIYAHVVCNTTENTGLGLRFGGYNGQPNIFTNRMVSNKIGFALDNEAYIGDVGSFEFPISGPTEVDAANEWQGTFGNSHTFNFSNSDPQNPPKYYKVLGGGGLVVNPSHASFGYFPIDTALTSNSNSISCTAPELVDHSSGKKKATTSYNKNGKSPHWRLRGNASDSAFYLRQQLQFYHLSKDSALYNSQQYSSFRDSMKNTVLGRALGKNSKAISMNNSTNFDQNVSAVEPLLNKHFADSTLDSTELGQLRQIAVLCPFEDGIAVYQARRVLHEYGERLYVNDCEVSNLPQNNKKGQPRIKDTTSQELTLNLYPNPAKDQLFFELITDKEGTYILELMDVLGKEVSRYGIQQNNKNQIDISQMQSGVYFYRLLNNDQVMESGKFVIR